jgi:hypothetical protein
MLNASRLIKDLITANWTANNTGGRTPEFSEYYNKKRIPGYANTDIVYTYNRRTDEYPTTTGNLARKVLNRVSIDCRTNLTDQHCNLIEAEVKRIIRNNANYSVPVTCTHSSVGQQVILEIVGTTPFSNTESSDYVHNYKRVIELDMTSWSELLLMGTILDDI